MRRSAYAGNYSLFLVLLFFTVSPVFGADTRGISDDTVKIGLISDTTGPVADLGTFLKMGAQDYFNNFNEKGTVHGRKIKLIHEDDQYQIPKAQAAFEKLVSKDEVLSVLHCGGTPQVMALMPKIVKDRVPVFPPGQYESMYEPYQRYIFVFGSTYADQAGCAIDYMMHDLSAKAPKVAVVYMENEVGRQGLEACKKRLSQYSLSSVAEVQLSLKSVDASSQVMSLKNANADFVILFLLPPAVINFLNTAKKFDYYPTYLSYTWCADDVIIKATGDAAKNGYYAATIFGSWYDDTPAAAEMRSIAQKYNHSSPKLPSLYIQGVVYAMMTIEGLKRAGRDLTVERYVDALETFKGYDCGGLLSPMTYTPKAHPPSPYSRICKANVEKGIFISITDWITLRTVK